MSFVAAAVSIGTGIAAGAATAGATIAGGLAAAAGAVGMTGAAAGLAGAATGMTGFAAGLGTLGFVGSVASAMTVGAIYGAGIGGIMGGAMAGINGGNIWKGVTQGAMSGATTGAITMGAGSVGMQAAKAAAFGTVGSAVLGGAIGGGLAYGGMKLTGASDREALIAGATTGVVSGYGAFKNAAAVEGRDLMEWLKLENPDVDPELFDEFAANHYGTMNILQAAGSGTGKLVQLTGAAAGMVSGTINVPGAGGTSGANADVPLFQRGSMSMPTLGDKGQPVDESMNDGTGWQRTTGELVGGVDTLANNKDLKPRTAVGLSDEWLLKNGAAIGA